MIEFGLDPKEDTHIVNGHVPVKRKDGESPIKCNGKVMVIDGDFQEHIRKKPELQDTRWFIIRMDYFGST